MGATTGWKEKHDESTRLMEQVKAARDEGIDTGEKSKAVHDMVARAAELGREAKAEKLQEDNDRLNEILEQHEKGQTLPTPAPQGNGSSMVAGLPTQQDEDVLRRKAESDFYGGGDNRIVMNDKTAAKLGVKDISRQAQNLDPESVKVLNEGTTTAGGFLVVPDFIQEMFAKVRRQGNALRRYGWLNEHRTNQTSSVIFPRGGGSATVGIVAENAAKPTADQTFSQVTVNIFTWAGISKVSNQLLADADPSISEIVADELATLLGNLEEQKILSGTGTGEPRGIPATTGVVVDAYTDASPTAQELIDEIIDNTAAFMAAHFAPPTGILMHPRRLAFLQKGKDSQLNYIFNSIGGFRAPGGFANVHGVNSVTTGETFTMPSLIGLPIGVSANVPTNFLAGVADTGTPGTQDIVIIGDWNEAHWFQRQDVTLDASNQTSDAFEKNQTWFRLEERAGFTAERYPTAFRIISGTGLVP